MASSAGPVVGSTWIIAESAFRFGTAQGNGVNPRNLLDVGLQPVDYSHRVVRGDDVGR